MISLQYPLIIQLARSFSVVQTTAFVGSAPSPINLILPFDHRSDCPGESKKDCSKDSACFEESVGATADAPEDISFEEISAGAARKQTEVVAVQERRRRYSAQEKIEFVKLTYAPGNSVSSIARQYNISPSLLFK